ncbi:SURF1 family protein [Nocardioides marmoriginsengisoli]|uniref:SURF1 family cytochrome oxidase biogenesis protein n=1 Tax=Nocardioides marmoriginsengisoli TaxID=661483 RepID=UPI001613C94A|nr:SURF1 family protein [Nocardioides marmoriginsengisoli]
MRFLFTRRWVLFALTVAALAWLATVLGQWQFHRLDDRKAENSLVARNLDQAPAPIDSLLKPSEPAPGKHEWRKVVVHGTWDDENTIVLKYQTRDGGPGVDVLTPLRTADGTGVLVDRGWMQTDNVGSERPELPAASTGTVTVIGWIRVDATGRATAVNDLATRAVSSRAVAKILDYPLYGGFLDLHTESPEPATKLAEIELPDDTSNGPHFFYGLQWWFFAALAIFGFGYLAFDEARQARRQREASEGAEHAAVDGEHDAGDEG